MIVIGLTGSIGMGKSATAHMFADEGVPICDSDAIVHALYGQSGAAVEAVGQAFPSAVDDGAVDRRKLASALAGDPRSFERLQAIVHPLVRAAQDAFQAENRQAGQAAVLLDIPLLFETGRDRDMDLTIVVTAPEQIQRDRVLARPGMTVEKFHAMLARQMPDAQKRMRADTVIDTSKGFDPVRHEVRRIVQRIANGDIHARSRSRYRDHRPRSGEG